MRKRRILYIHQLGGVHQLDLEKYTFEIPTNSWLVIYERDVNRRSGRKFGPYRCYSPAFVRFIDVREELAP